MGARPVKYKGIQFRSTTEARWAFLFDKLGWEWKYECQYLNWYVPDFILIFKEPLLFEVKYAYHPMACLAEKSKVVGSGWKGEAVISCVDLMRSHSQPGFIVGVLGERHKEAWDWGPAELSWCRKGEHFGLYHEHGSWGCRTCGLANGPNDWDHSKRGQLEGFSAEATNFFRYIHSKEDEGQA